MPENNDLLNLQTDQTLATPKQPTGQLTVISPTEAQSVGKQPVGTLTAQKPTPETWGQMATRNIATAAKGVGQRLLGFPGDIESLARSVGRGAGRMVGLDIDTPLTEKALKLAPDATPEEEKEIRARYGQLESFGERGFPTSKEVGKKIKTFSEDVFGVRPDYFKSKNAVEKIAQSSLKDAASILTSSILFPGGFLGKTYTAIASVLPNLAKFGAKKLGLGKPAQRMTKLGTQLMTTLFRLYDPKKEAAVAKQAVENILPKTDVSMDARKVARQFDKIDRVSSYGIQTPKKKFLQNVLKDIDYADRGNSIRVRSAMRLNDDLGELIKSTKTPAEALPFLEKLQSSVGKSLKAFGKVDPAFGKAFQYSQGLSKSINSTSAAVDFIEKWTDKKKLGALGGLVWFGSKNPIWALGSVGATMGIKGGAKVLDKLASSSAMRKYFGKILSLATARKGQQLSKVMQKFNEELTKEFPVNKKPYKE